MKLYEKIYNDLKKRIARGEFDNSTLLPTDAALQEQYGVSRITVQHAYDKLCDDNLVERIPGKGTVLKKDRRRQSGNRLIGLVLCDFGDTFGSNLIKHIVNAANAYNAGIVIKISNDDYMTECKVLTELYELSVDGIIIQNCHGAYTKRLLELTLEDFPIVSVDRYAKGLLVPSVTSNNHDACVKATSYLIENGCKNLLFASCAVDRTSTLTERINGFKQAHVDNDFDLAPDNFITCLKSPITHSLSDAHNDIEVLKNTILKVHTDAVIASEEYVAELCTQALKICGRNIPDDCQIISFDSANRSFDKSKYTYVRQNEYELGKYSVDNLMRLIDRKNVPMRTFAECDIVFGNSTK